MEQGAKKLVVLGGGESGVGAALLGQANGWQVFVSDGGRIKDEYRAELNKAGVAFEEGSHTISRLLAADCIVKSPGISDKSDAVRLAREAGKCICGEIEFAYQYKGNSRIVAITGSNGKSTTTKLTYQIMKKGGLSVAMGGNIGYSFARLLTTPGYEWYVLELSSFQLDDIRKFRPDIAVLLNITPDHLDRYEYDLNLYIKSKFRITENQQDQDFFIVNADDPVIKKHLEQHSVKAHKLFFTMNHEMKLPEGEGARSNGKEIEIMYNGEVDRFSIDELTIKGKHNQYNSMAAGISARATGIRKTAIREVFSTFETLEHRLEEVATIRGVRFINDSKATNMNSVWFALESMTQPTVLILGGQDKGNDYSEIMELVAEKVKAIVCLGLNNGPILQAFGSKINNIIETKNAKDAVLAAYALAEKGDTVLLSPGCASFDIFEDFNDRGNQFKAAVRAL